VMRFHVHSRVLGKVWDLWLAQILRVQETHSAARLRLEFPQAAGQVAGKRR
jgi:hypothetical protein